MGSEIPNQLFIYLWNNARKEANSSHTIRFSCFSNSSLELVTSKFILRQIALIQKSFRCEMGFSPNIWKSTYTIEVNIQNGVLNIDLHNIKNSMALQVPFYNLQHSVSGHTCTSSFKKAFERSDLTITLFGNGLPCSVTTKNF